MAQMTEREELEGLRRLAELESRESGEQPPAAVSDAPRPPIDGTPAGTIGQDGRPADTTLGEQVVAGLEVGAALGSSILAEPIAGIAGLAKSITSGEQAGAQAVEDIRAGLSFAPRTQLAQGAVNAIGEALGPVAEAFQRAEKFLGDTVFESTKSPTLAAAAATFPTLITELAGFGIGKKIAKSGKGPKVLRDASKKTIAKAANEASPTVDQLKDISRGIYNELDQAGITMKPEAVQQLVRKVEQTFNEFKTNPDLTPAAFSVLEEFQEIAQGAGTSLAGRSLRLSEVDEMRKLAQRVASKVDPTEKALGVNMIDTIDTFLDNVGGNALEGATKVNRANVAKQYKAARNMWGRARKSELFSQAMDAARETATGFENGVRIEFRKILRNKKQRRFFSKDEIEEMRKVTDGTAGSNVARLIGKLGFTDGKTSNLIGGTVGTVAGAAAGGTTGGFVIPFIGSMSKKLAERLTKGNAKFADSVIRAGKNGNKITAAYLRNTPKNARSIEELSQLLARGDIDLVGVPDTKFVQDAVAMAARRRGGEVAILGGAAATAIPREESE